MGMEKGKNNCAVINSTLFISRPDVIIVQDLGQFSGVKSAVHHFGHLLGAYHDNSSSDCCSGDGYVMSKSKYNENNLGNYLMSLPNSSFWSPCSVKAIEEFVSTATCLFNEPEVDDYPLFDWQDLVDQIEGGPPSLTNQCSPYGSPALICGDNPCQYLECQVPDYSTVSDRPPVICKVQEKNYAMEGTSCGTGKYCFQGNCIKGNKNQLFKLDKLNSKIGLHTTTHHHKLV